MERKYNDGSMLSPAVARASFHVKAAMPRAEADATRPLFHFHSPSQWMNDPCGMILDEGWYHVFYQFNPYADTWGTIHWGHARTRDFVHWEHMPAALYPSVERGEEHCFSGCATRGPGGKPFLCYTSIATGRSPGDYAEQWLACGDGQLMVWKKHAENPVVAPSSFGNLKVTDWRDPFIFRIGERILMATGGKLADESEDASVFLHEASDASMTKWVFKGVMFRHPDKALRSVECPNFFRLGDKYVLLVSPYGPVQFFCGNFDAETNLFTSSSGGLVDYSIDFYATHVLHDPTGRSVMLGWIRGFEKGRGWNGCLSLPRSVSIDEDGRLLQSPVNELKRLRGNYVKLPAFMLNNTSQVLENVKGSTLELIVELEPLSNIPFGLNLRCSADGKRGIAVCHRDGLLDICGTTVPVTAGRDRPLKLHVFVDRSVLEVFVNSGESCITKVITAATADLCVSIFAGKGDLIIRSVDAWNLRMPA